MYICIIIVYLCNFIHNSAGFIITNIYSNRNTLQQRNMLNDEYINLIQKYNGFFNKENVIDLINNINSNKISEIFISKDYKELIGVDNLISTNIYQKFHLTQVTPVEIQYILNKGYDHNIPIYFIDFYSKSNVISSSSIISILPRQDLF